MWSKTLPTLALALLLAGCDAFPQDMRGTTERVAEDDVLRAGIISCPGDEGSIVQALASRIAEGAQAEATFERGSAEDLLRGLEEGELDLVVGYFAKNSPWKKRVTFTESPHPGEAGKEVPVLRAAVRNGENRWLLFVHRQIKEDAG